MLDIAYLPYIFKFPISWVPFFGCEIIGHFTVILNVNGVSLLWP
jgi:hypothetical protein